MTTEVYKTHHYLVQLQAPFSGQTKEVDYFVHWDPNREGAAMDAARACAAEHTVASGSVRTEDGMGYKTKWIGQSAELVLAEA